MPNLGFIDIAMIIILAVLGSLSKRLGEALKVAPYYKFFYVAIFATTISAFFDSGSYTDVFFEIHITITLAIRLVSVLLALYATIKYWHWLFSELNN